MLLIKNIHVYAPEDLGIQDVLVANDKIALIQKHIPASKHMEVIDGTNKIMTPGLIDRHVHVCGGGGEAGFASRAPEIRLSSLIQAGITTVVGLLGTDGITRNIEGLLAKVKALKEEGISAYALCGSYSFPSCTITGSIQKDIMFIDEILGVKLAISDHRSSHVTLEELERLASEVRVAGMLANKSGCITLHMGDEEEELSYVMKLLKKTDLPIHIFHPTHVTRNARLYQKALQFLYMGGTIDITSTDKGNSSPYIKQANAKDYERITLSSDGQGSWSTYDEAGNLTNIGVSSVDVLLQDVLSMIKEKAFTIETAFSFVTKNPANVLGLYPKKGCIIEGSDADILMFDATMKLCDVLAYGTWMMRNKEIVTFGTYEK